MNYLLFFLLDESAFELLSIRTRIRHQKAERRTKRMQTRIALSIANLRIPPRAGITLISTPKVDVLGSV